MMKEGYMETEQTDEKNEERIICKMVVPSYGGRAAGVAEWVPG